MKNKRGITLIALVITIIILLILAGITIIQLTNNRLFEKVRLSKEKSDEAQAEENEILDDYKNVIGAYINSARDESENNYSNEEIKIGTWIDGKPLYRKVIQEKITATGSLEYFLDNKVENAESYIIESAYVFSNETYIGNGMMVSSANNYSNYDFAITSFNLNTGRIWLKRGTDAPSYLQLVVKYTKKIDSINK